MHHKHLFLTSLATLVLASCASGPHMPTPAPMSAAVGAALRSCGELAGQFQYGNTSIESAATVASGMLKVADSSVAEHCLVKGAMFKRKGSDGQDYQIGFEMRLPAQWNGRFYYQANGGIDGVVQPALGNTGGGPVTGALLQGFAVISSDAGHGPRQNPKFGEEPQARLDYGYQAVAKLTPMAKALIQAAYGKTPDRSYMGGCSNGGRHAMVAAARIGQEYDGYLIGAPGYRLPQAALAQLWAGPGWLELATPGATVNHPFAPTVKLPDLGSALTAQERQSVANAVLDKCDALDGLRDGMVQNVRACQSRFMLDRDVATCKPTRDGSCLTQQQKNMLASVQAGGRTGNGTLIYSSFPYDSGIAGANWAQWKFVNSLVLDPAAGYIFMSPPRSVTPFKVDVDDSYKAIFATASGFPESADAVITPPGKENPTNLAALQGRGAKMVVYHGVSDAIFSADDTRHWYERLNKAQSGKAAQFARYFPVPGMNHCSAGPAADQFDLLSPLVAWVEQGVAPQAVIATARGVGNAGGVNAELPRDWSANRTRPLCAYPSVATYKGSGDAEAASSFSCR